MASGCTFVVGVTVELTFQQFVGLFEQRQLYSLQKAIERNRLRYQQREKNEFAYVATWKSYNARSTNVWSVDTACICSRQKSATINLPQAGDTLRPEHCDAISRSLTGKPKSETRCQNISASKKGVPIRGWTEERKAARRAQLAARRAANGSAEASPDH